MTTTTYATAAELRTQINKSVSTGTATDAALLLILQAASDAIDRECNRPDGLIADSVATVRTYSGSGKTFMLIDECVSITTVAVKDSPTDTAYVTWASTDWIPFSGDAERPNYNQLPYTGVLIDPTGDYDIFTSGYFSTMRGFRPVTSYGRGVPTVQITARWGYSTTVPPIIKQATLAQAAQWLKRGEAAWADTVATAELGPAPYMTLSREIKAMITDARLIRPSLAF